MTNDEQNGEPVPFVLWPHGLSANRIFGCKAPHNKEVRHRGDGRAVCSCACHTPTTSGSSAPPQESLDIEPQPR